MDCRSSLPKIPKPMQRRPSRNGSTRLRDTTCRPFRQSPQSTCVRAVPAWKCASAILHGPTSATKPVSGCTRRWWRCCGENRRKLNRRDHTSSRTFLPNFVPNGNDFTFVPTLEKLGTLIVTGASRGIGAAIARLAAERGFSVAVNFAKGKVEAEAIARQIVSAGGRARAIQADVAREEDVIRLFETAERELGAIRGLVNNAAITGGFSRVDAVSASALAQVMAVNVTGAILCAREAVRRMSTGRGGTGGAIVNISSRAAKTGSAGEWVHYAASKGAIDSFTIGLAREVATEGIRVNAVAPGLVDTDLHAANGKPGRLQRLMPTIPMQRAGKPHEVAEGVLWLLSPAASYTTGTILEIGGGR